MDSDSDGASPTFSELLLSLVPTDGTPIGNVALRRAMEARPAAEGRAIAEQDYWEAHARLIAQGLLLKGQGRGGSVRRPVQVVESTDEDFTLQTVSLPPEESADAVKARAPTRSGPRTAVADQAAQIIGYRHTDKRKNNPEVGMVTPATDPDGEKTHWAYDPHLDAALPFDSQRAAIETLIDEALASGDAERIREAHDQLTGHLDRTRIKAETSLRKTANSFPCLPAPATSRRRPTWAEWRLAVLVGLWLLRLPIRLRHCSLTEFLTRLSAARAGKAPVALIPIDRAACIVRRVARFRLFRLPCFPRICLRQSLALFWVLGRLGHRAELHFGVCKEGEALRAHGWVTVNGEPLLEEAGEHALFEHLYTHPSVASTTDASLAGDRSAR